MKKEKGLLLFIISTLFVFTIGVIVFFIVNSSFLYAPSTPNTPYYPEPDLGGKPDSCQALSCHGTDMKCGVQKEPLQCTMMYQIGDNCRQHARCQTVGGECMLIKEDFFDTCVSCVEKCEETFAGSNDPSEVFSCESSCMGMEQEQTLLRVCPEEKITNTMPGSVDNSDVLQENRGILPREYFILNGERRDIGEFDRAWVEENCFLEEQIVW
ncbi:MAG: hypothetical protein EOM19_01810 [Candidatus Moranbacteria bacterium]|nr:hypothetical protein [Candidatus Moranbacteria bacterium]